MGYSGIMFDGKRWIDYTIDNPGPYQRWQGGKVVALITRTQYEMMEDATFWQKKYDQQMEYIAYLADMKFYWTGRKQQLLMSALEVLEMVKKKMNGNT